MIEDRTRRQRGRPMIAVRIGDELRSKLRAIAEAEGVTVSDVARDMLARELDRHAATNHEQQTERLAS